MSTGHHRLLLACACVCVCVAIMQSTACAQRLQVQAQPERVYVGQPLTLSVTVADAEMPARPELPPSILENFQVVPLHEQTSSSIQIMGSQMVRSTTVTYPWQLIPRRPGVIQLEAITMTLGNGQKLSAASPAIRVLEPQAHGEIFITTSVNPPRPIRDMPITLVIEIGIKVESESDPLRTGRADLEISLPWRDLPADFSGEDLGTWLSPFLAQSGAFTIEGTTVSGGGIFSSQRKARFELIGRVEMRELSTTPGVNSRYMVYRLERVVTPKSSGAFAFGRAVLSGALGGKQRYLVSEELTVDVQEAPRAGRPESWTGAIGDLRVSAATNVQKLRVGDPLTLTITLAGKVNLESLRLPDLAVQPALASRFKIHQEEAGTIEGNQKRFKVTLRPIDATVTEVPPIALATFDAERMQYSELKTNAIALVVESSEILSGTEIVQSDAATARRPANLRRSSEGILANHTGFQILVNHGHSSKLVLTLVGLLVALQIIMTIVVTMVRRRNQDVDALRRRNAARVAREAMAAALDDESQMRALLTYVADIQGWPASGVTSADVERALAQADAHVTAGDAASGATGGAEVLATLRELEASRYGGATSRRVDASAARATLERLIALLPTLLFFLFALTPLSMTHASSADDRAELLLSAEDAFRSATTDEQFAAVAARYEAALADGFVNGHVLYNLGNALARAGEIGKAIAAYERAQRHLPRDPDLIENLRVLRLRVQDRFERPRSLASEVLFWEGWLGEREHAHLLVCLWLVAALALAARLLLWRRTPKALIAIIMLVAGLQLVAYLHVLELNHGRTLGVVTADEIVLRKGPGESYEPAYDSAIHEGAPFIVRERRSSWLEIEVPGGERAWIPETAATLY